MSLESHLCSVSLRPRIPPAALHQPTKASALSKSSWSRPGRAVAPGSAIVPTEIVLSVTPCAVAVFALPGPHTPLRVPKSPDAALDVAPEDFGLLELLLERLHPVASKPVTSRTTHQLRTLTRTPENRRPAFCLS